MNETAINIISEGTRLEGKFYFEEVCRVFGILVGEVHAAPGSTLILGDSSMVEGDVYADTLIIDGYVKGNIVSSGKVLISASGRVIGTIKTPTLKLEPGSYFEGHCSTEEPSAS
jgi:cytoskeletal protein CcmA (bactofilin family)